VKRAYYYLEEKYLKESADYMDKHLDNVVIIDDDSRARILNIALNEIKLKGLHCEFGVHQALQLNYLAKAKPNQHWYGFDSFEGLQENWKGGYFGKGHFSLNGKLPKVEKNITLIKGWFKNTVKKFVLNNKENFAFILIDCDTYQSTKDILNNIPKNKIKKDTIIYFDEYFGYPGWKQNEYKAWQEYVKTHNIKYEYLAFGFMQAVIKIK